MSYNGIGGIMIVIILGLFGAVFLISVLGSVSGVGGGVLYIPLFLFVFVDWELANIKFLSTLLVFFSSLFNVTIELYKRKLSLFVILIGLTFSLPAGFLGQYINSIVVSDLPIKISIIVILTIVTGLLIYSEYGLKNKTYEKNNYKLNKFWYIQNNQEKKLNIILLSAIAFLGGIITSISGMGGGPILMPLLIMICKLDMKAASPISHTFIMISSFINLAFDYKLIILPTTATIGIPLILACLIGSISAIYVKKILKKEIIIKWILIVLIWVSIIKIVIDIF